MALMTRPQPRSEIVVTPFAMSPRDSLTIYVYSSDANEWVASNCASFGKMIWHRDLECFVLWVSPGYNFTDVIRYIENQGIEPEVSTEVEKKPKKKKEPEITGFRVLSEEDIAHLFTDYFTNMRGGTGLFSIKPLSADENPEDKKKDDDEDDDGPESKQPAT